MQFEEQFVFLQLRKEQFNVHFPPIKVKELFGMQVIQLYDEEQV